MSWNNSGPYPQGTLWFHIFYKYIVLIRFLQIPIKATTLGSRAIHHLVRMGPIRRHLALILRPEATPAVPQEEAILAAHRERATPAPHRPPASAFIHRRLNRTCTVVSMTMRTQVKIDLLITETLVRSFFYRVFKSLPSFCFGIAHFCSYQFGFLVRA